MAGDPSDNLLTLLIILCVSHSKALIKNGDDYFPILISSHHQSAVDSCCGREANDQRR